MNYMRIIKIYYLSLVIIICKSSIIVLAEYVGEANDEVFSYDSITRSEQGDVCNLTTTYTQHTGVCQLIRDCPVVVNDIQNKRPHTHCSWQGKFEIVCCPKKDIISQKKCIEYGRAVHEEINLPVDVPHGEERTMNIDGCGHKVIDLVVGGENAKGHEFPHMALIGFNTSDGTKLWKCGGTLISDYYILTAAHCLYLSAYGEAKYVRLGELDINSDIDDAMPEDFNIAKLIPHPDYNNDSYYHDIALVKMERPVQFSFYKRPACLPSIKDNIIEKAIATGWGQIVFAGPFSSHLQKVILENFTNAECEKIYTARRKMSSGFLSQFQICVGSHSDERDTCQGDSGSPLQIYHHEQYCMYTVIGITSFGIGCGTKGIPALYTRIYAYHDWIERVVWS